MRIAFAKIDARDDPNTGYDPVAFATDEGPLSLGPVGTVLQALMNQEYLVRLGALQQEIAAKYAPMCNETLLTSTDDVEIVAAALATRAFPGPVAEYYT